MGTRGRTDLGRPRQFWPTKAGRSWRWAGTEEAVTPSARYGGRPSFSPPRSEEFPMAVPIAARDVAAVVGALLVLTAAVSVVGTLIVPRSEERRVGKEW